MKTLLNILTIFIFFNLACTTLEPVTTQSPGVSFQVFYDDLSPHGQWIDDYIHGYVWVPYDRGITPYRTNGHWVYTDFGWTWVSGYDWGWAPFHYGRWDYDNYYGWFWVPDYEWGPAWVVWRRADGYFGWAPMKPGHSVRESFNVDYPADRWIFVSERNFENRNVDRYVDRTNNLTIINNSTIINNTYRDNTSRTAYVTGPRRETVQRATGREVRAVNVREINNPGQRLVNDQLQIYKPQIRRDYSKRPAPSKVITPPEDKRPVDRTVAPSSSGSGRGDQGSQRNLREKQNEQIRQQQEHSRRMEQQQEQQRQQIELQRQEQLQQEQNRRVEQQQQEQQERQRQQIERQRQEQEQQRVEQQRKQQEQTRQQQERQKEQSPGEKSTNSSRR